MIVFGLCVGDGSRYASVAGPFLESQSQPGDVIITDDGSQGICAAYNRFIDDARARPDCEALVLLHDDVEIHDRNFRAKILCELRQEDVAIVGAIGGRGLRSLEWWEARATAGMVYETRGPIAMRQQASEVDAVDGLLLAISPVVFTSVRFDEVGLPRLHGYDVDICLQARALGKRVVVCPIDLLHRTKGGYGDQQGFEQANAKISEKWPTWIIPDSGPQVLRTRSRRWVTRLKRRVSNNARRRLRQPRSPEQVVERPVVPTINPPPPEAPRLLCGACGGFIALTHNSNPEPRILSCLKCGSGATWPPPTRNVASDELFTEMYGDKRLDSRSQWFHEARSRLTWIQTHVPEGLLVEVGCATGEFVMEAEQAGFQAYGIETSEWAASHARELGARVTAGYLADWTRTFPGYRADVATLWHVLEHVPDPGKLIDEISASLRPGGMLFLEVPNFESVEASRLGIDWDGAQPSDHFHHFTVAGLTALLSDHGFTVVSAIQMSTRVYTSTETWQRLRNQAMIDRRPWPPLELLRVAALKPS